MANHVLIETIALTQNAASVTFDNIPQTGYTDLKIVTSARVAGSNNGEVVNIAFNGSTSNISARLIYADAPSTVSLTSTSNAFWVPGSGATANTFGNSELYFPNYNSGFNKSWSTDSVLGNNNNSYILLLAGLWSQTASITSITLTPPLQSFVANSTFSLYGVAAVGSTPTIAPKATGGNIVANDGTYWYHAFLSSGIFSPQTSLTCDALVIAGGGGGGGSGWTSNGDTYGAGGGGAGGLLLHTSQSLTNKSYAVAIGGGGSGGFGGGGNSVNTGQGKNGFNSQFGSLAPSIGGGGAGYDTGPRGTNGSSGGSGGGGAPALSTSPAGGYGGTGTSAQGNAGGNAGTQGGGGGGGGGAVGSAGTTNGGNGGAGVLYSAFATATGTGASGYYAGGGGGAKYVPAATSGSGGAGGGGAGAANVQSNGNNGTVNTGGGGGGAGGTNGSTTSGIWTGGSGSSGIVIIRYAI